MATVIFYEKPGCINNTRQKKMLRQAGHCVIEYDLREVRWTVDNLLEFFSAMPVAEWFNCSAPQIKSGEVMPDECSVDQALGLLVASPLLIRRPLMRVGHEVMVGFDQDMVDNWIGLQSRNSNDLESCARHPADITSICDVRPRSL